ncbi:IS21-like element ISMbo1 family transposase [Microbacterium oryzae]
MEDWAEIRRLHKSEKLGIKQIASKLSISRNTVRRALRSDEPPRYERGASGSLVDPFVPRIMLLLKEYPRMPATVIAERVGWTHSASIFRAKVSELRPLFAGIDPADRTEYTAGDIIQCDLWFPAVPIPVAPGQAEILPVLVMTLGYSRFHSALMIPSRQGGDILEGMWQIIQRLGRVPRTFVWDRESAIGGTGKLTVPAATFAGVLSTRFRLAPAADPEFKGMVERNNHYFETSFLPGRTFTSPGDFNRQLQDWLARTANVRTVRSIQARPVDLLEEDLRAMIDLPRTAPSTGLRTRVRLARDYYVRVDANDYSVDPRMIGKNVDITATADEVLVFCDGVLVARHRRAWGSKQVVKDPAHVETAKRLRHEFNDLAHARAEKARHAALGTKAHADGHQVQIRALTDYDALFGVTFTTTPDTQQAATSGAITKEAR